MTEDAELRRQLLQLIEARRRDIDAFLREVRPRRNRLTNVSIVSSAVAAIFVAGPAVGGPRFTEAVQDAMDLSKPTPVWQGSCLVALIVSLVAVVSTNISRSQDLPGHVAAAESCKVDLEGLQTFLRFGGLPVHEAAELYKQYVAKIPFIDGSSVMPEFVENPT